MTASFARLSAILADRYLLQHELGHGGMATVYLAKDLKHNRKVALKVLRPELLATLGSSRFLLEIEFAAQLQHPHILPLLDSGEAEGVLYYTMPYVDGESLRQRLARQGELPVGEAVRILSEVADALAYAHRSRVIHRDLKPENIMLSGRHALVTDFGIAKALSLGGTSGLVTTEGIALGTPAYMAPEQATADPHLDHEVDIYAFGVIGYELLTGTTPFVGGSSQQILAAHVTQRPEPILARRPTAPVELGNIMMRCLEKRPADRPQSAEEILRVLETVVTPHQGLTPTGSGRAVLGPRLRGLLIAASVVILGAATLHLITSHLAPARVAPRQSQLTFDGKVENQEVSPDGQFLAYIERGEFSRLLVKDLKGTSLVHVANLGPYSSNLRWSPDGSSILYAGPDSVGRWISVLFPRLGGAPRPTTGRGGFQEFSRDGSRTALWFTDRSPVFLRTLASNTVDSILLPATAGWLGPGDWSPDDRNIAIVSSSETGNRWMLWATNLESKKSRQLIEDTLHLSPPRWTPSGDALYYIRDNNELLKLRISRDGFPIGLPEVLQIGLGASDFSITADGSRLVYTKRQQYSNLWSATSSAGDQKFVSRRLTQGTALKSGGAVSPTDTLLAFIQVKQGKGDVYVVGLDGGTPRQVTSSGVAVARKPVWSPDLRQLAYAGNIRGTTRVQTVDLESGRERTYERTVASQSSSMAWAPVERILYPRPGNRNFYWLNTNTGEEEPLVTNDSVGWMFFPHISPDQQTVAVFWNRAPEYRGTYLISLGDGSQIRVRPRDSWPLGWSIDGTSLYVEEQASRRIYRVSPHVGTGVFIGINSIEKNLDNVPDCELTERSGRVTIVCNVQESLSDVWMMENFDPTD